MSLLGYGKLRRSDRIGFDLVFTGLSMWAFEDNTGSGKRCFRRIAILCQRRTALGENGRFRTKSLRSSLHGRARHDQIVKADMGLEHLKRARHGISDRALSCRNARPNGRLLPGTLPKAARWVSMTFLFTDAAAPHDVSIAAERAGLTYLTDSVPGISRAGRAGHFRYRLPSGHAIRDRATLERIRRLVIPPAWTQVWIALHPDGHIQATGRDARGRKQYKYHPDFAQARDSAKFAHLVQFAQALPKLRRQVTRDLRQATLTRTRVIALVVTLLEQTLIRVGNEDYARTNNSFGLTTLRNRHVKVCGAQVRFLFKGKSGKQWSLSVHDRRVARVIRSCQELPGQHLFEYRDEDETVRCISSSDVNEYLRAVTNQDITAKDFRTWAGTVLAATSFGRQAAATKKAVREVIGTVAEQLGNTVAVCRRCYIHPAVISGFELGSCPCGQRPVAGVCRPMRRRF